MTLQELIDALSHIRDTNPEGGGADVMLTMENPEDLGDFIDSPAQSVYVQVGHVFVSGVEDV